MKRFLDRFVVGARHPDADTPAEADDEGFFATQFMERPEDLRVFDAEAFVDALLPEALGA